MATREEIRTATLGASQPLKKEIFEWNGVEIEVREVLEGERQAIVEASMNEDGTAIDRLKWRYNSIIATCFDSKGESVYADTDIEGFKAQPISGFVLGLSRVVDTILDVTVPGTDGATIEADSPKNSETTQADS